MQHANGVVEELRAGDVIRQGDIVETRDGSTLGISFIDGTAFNMGASARMAISELVYDANGTSNSAVFSLVKGAISFVAGQAAKTGDMRVDTPVASMGIRGTSVNTNIATDINGNTVSVTYSLMQDLDGSVGSFTVFDSVTGAVIGTITTTDTTFTLTPTAAGLNALFNPKSAQEVAQELAVAQALFPIFLSNPANATVPTPQDVQPQALSSGSSIPPGGSTQPLPTPPITPPPPSDPINLPNNGNSPDNTDNTNNTGNGGDPPIPVNLPANTPPSVFANIPPKLIEAVALDAGTATSVANIFKIDLDGTASFDTSGWQDLGNGIFARFGVYGAAALNTAGSDAAVLMSAGWTDLGNGIFQKDVISAATGMIETIRVSLAADTLTYALDNDKADSLGAGENASETFVVNVVDNDGGTASTSVVYAIDGQNDAPVITIANPGAIADQDSYIDIAGIQIGDPDLADILTVTLQVSNGALELLSSGNLTVSGAGTNILVVTGLVADIDAAIAGGLRYTPAPGYAGGDSLSIDVSDGQGATQSQSVAITVNPGSGNPQTNPVAVAVDEDGAVSISLTGSDSNGTVVAFRIADTGNLNGQLYSDSSYTQLLNAGDLVATSSGGTVTVYFVPAADFNGQATFTFAAQDNDGLEDLTPATATIDVTPVNDAPVLNSAIADQVSNEDTPWFFQVPQGSFADIDSPLTYVATLGNGDPLPAWLSFDAGTQTFAGTPPQGFTGQLDLKVVASDGQYSAFDTFTLNVDSGNGAPVLTIFPGQPAVLSEDGVLDSGVLITVTDSPGDTFQYDMTGWTPVIAAAAGAIEFDGHYYLFINAPVNWNDASQIAQSLGGYLANITSQAENDFIVGNVTGYTPAWIGATDAAQEGEWV